VVNPGRSSRRDSTVLSVDWLAMGCLWLDDAPQDRSIGAAREGERDRLPLLERVVTTPASWVQHPANTSGHPSRFSADRSIMTPSATVGTNDFRRSAAPDPPDNAGQRMY